MKRSRGVSGKKLTADEEPLTRTRRGHGQKRKVEVEPHQDDSKFMSELLVDPSTRPAAEDHIREVRSLRYGPDHKAGHGNLGLMWTGLLQNHYGIQLAHPIPAHLVEIMMALNKANRVAVDPQGLDHYVDGRAYFAMAEEAAGAVAVEEEE